MAEMKLRARTIGCDWHEIDVDALIDLLKKSPTSYYEVKSICKHRKTSNFDGETRCLRCNDLIKITSYRD